jgi:hypothetical protein
MRLTRLLSTLTLLSIAACGGSSDSLTGTDTGGSGSGPMSATIDGTAWVSPVPAGRRTSNIVAVAGLDLGLTASVSFAFVATSTGTYSVAFANTNFGSATIAKGSLGWSSALSGGSGSVTLTTLTASHMVGTFAFDAVPASGGATGTIHVTNGKFDITF